MKMSIKSALLITTGGLMMATPALAQTTPQDDVSSANDEGEIIVTATLREANVQNIPIAVTA